MGGFNILDLLPVVLAFISGNLWQVLSYRRKATSERQDILEKMRDELDDLYAELLKLRKQVWDMEQVNTELKNEIAAVVKQRDEFQERVRQLEDEIEKHLKEADRLRAKIVALGGDANGHKNGKVK